MVLFLWKSKSRKRFFLKVFLSHSILLNVDFYFLKNNDFNSIEIDASLILINSASSSNFVGSLKISTYKYKIKYAPLPSGKRKGYGADAKYKIIKFYFFFYLLLTFILSLCFF